MHAIARGGCMDAVRESALKVDWEKNPLPQQFNSVQFQKTFNHPTRGNFVVVISHCSGTQTCASIAPGFSVALPTERFLPRGRPYPFCYDCDAVF